MARNKHPEETVNLILDVALVLFFEKGYDNTSIQDIIDGLGGLTKGAVYHHFKSKEDILLAALDRDNRALFDELRRIRERRPHDRRREAAGAVRGIHHRAADGHVGQGGPRRGSGEERAFAGPAVPGGAPGDGARFRVAHRGAGGARRQHPNRSSARVQRGHRAVGEPLGQPMFRSATAEELRARVDYYLDIVKALGGLSLEVGGLATSSRGIAANFTKGLML